MCKVIAVGNQKGGVGKSTTTGNLGIGLAMQGKKVLLIDADSQGSLTASLGYEQPDEMEETLANVLEMINDRQIFPEGYGILHHDEGVDLLPSNIELSGVEFFLEKALSRETLLRRYVNQIKDNYDYILIDCMPSLSLITMNAFTCADTVLIPVQAAYLPYKGLEQLFLTCRMSGMPLIRISQWKEYSLLWWISGQLMQEISVKCCEVLINTAGSLIPRYLFP